MKYSHWIGVLAILIMGLACTMPWVKVREGEIVVSGFYSIGNDLFGRPGVLHYVFGGMALILFLIQRLWAKRVNVFACAINLAFALANFYRIGVLCRTGDCPVKQTGLYLMLATSVIIFIMSLLPRLEVRKK
jgi:hypothetical protein